MKNKKRRIKILFGIISFCLVILIMWDVNALTFSEIENSQTIKDDVNYASDTSGSASSLNRIFNPIMKIYKWGAFLFGCVLLINVIRCLINKKIKNGIIYFLIAGFLIWSAIMVNSMDVHDHNIMP